MTEKEAYEALADFIKDYIYEKNWEHLNSMQIKSIEKVLEGKNNLLLTAGTAMGKTEAALMPVITSIYKKPVCSVGVLYVSPLKALINDQFNRIEDMLLGSGIKITKWHGDASKGKKDKLLSQPNGIIQTTPESLEAMLCRHPENVKILFSDLRFIIIDEIHYFIGSERGMQLLAILERFQRITNNSPIRIGLSATINNTDRALEYLSAGSNRLGEVIDYVDEKRKYMVSVTSTTMEEELTDEYVLKILKCSLNERALLFTNSRRQCEKLMGGIRKMAERLGLPDTYYIHHGSISKSIRENTEDIMKNTTGPILTGTTLTLELGIDIGDLDEVIQADQPISISSMVQRVGRSGRKTKNSKISFHLRNFKSNIKKPEKLDLKLIRTIAIIELYFRHKYLEDMTMAKLPYELVIHEVLSIICEKGCLYPPQLAREVLELSVFKNISQGDLRIILKRLIEKDILKVYDDGALGMSDMGEAISNNLEFYSVFKAEETFNVICNNSEIGTVDKAYKEGQRFFLAGRTWQVTGCDLKRHRIDVMSIKMDADIFFAGKGQLETDKVIMAKIHEILSIDKSYSYLDEDAKSILEEVRERARYFNLHKEICYEDETDNLLLYPILGTKTINTIYYLFNSNDISCDKIYLKDLLYGLRLYAIGIEELKRMVSFIKDNGFYIDKELILTHEHVERKYFELLTDDLKYKEILSDVLDVPGAKDYLIELLKQE